MKNRLSVSKSQMMVSVSRTDEPVCAVCGKPLGEHVLCYSVNSLQVVTVPLCVDCLRKGADMLEKANLIMSLSGIDFPAELDITYENKKEDSICMERKSFATLAKAEEYFNGLIKDSNVGNVSYEIFK